MCILIISIPVCYKNTYNTKAIEAENKFTLAFPTFIADADIDPEIRMFVLPNIDTINCSSLTSQVCPTTPYLSIFNATPIYSKRIKTQLCIQFIQSNDTKNNILCLLYPSSKLSLCTENTVIVLPFFTTKSTTQ